MAEFTLHPQLDNDTFVVANFTLCQVLLMNDANFPWLVLVPKVPDIREIHELTPGDQQQLMQEITFVSTRLQRLTRADKMNVAALGNMVPQLHVHVIARFETDAAWPGPMWGKVPAAPYSDDALEEMMAKLKKILI